MRKVGGLYKKSSLGIGKMDPDHESSNELSWNRLFEALPILKNLEKNGCYEISAEKIRQYAKREPRLMVTFPNAASVPSILKNHDLGVLPIKSRGHYLIGHFDIFVSTIPGKEVDTEIHKLSIGNYYDTLEVDNIARETSAILTAFNYGALAEICGCDYNDLHITNYGKAFSPAFSFIIRNCCGGADYEIPVNRSQIEMDGVFESSDSVINIEAKIGSRDDFVGRQLFYPFHYLRQNTEKNIINVFLTYSGGSIFTHIYNIEDPSCYNSFKLEKICRFDLFEEISINEIQDVVYFAQIAKEPEVPFPQANSFQKVLDCLDILQRRNYLTSSALATELGLEPRQGSYYGDACTYLGLTTKEKYGSSYKYNLSNEGKTILQMKYKDRMLRLVELIARHDVFNYFLRQYLETAKPPTKEQIAEWLAHNTMKGNEMSTVNRRASTVLKWINWVIELAGN